MKSITFTLPEKKSIEINGQVFELLKSDIDIMDNAAQLRAKCNKLTSKKNAKGDGLDEIVGAVKSVISFIDEVLGSGAVASIMQGRSICIVDALRLLTLISKAALDEYRESQSEESPDDHE
jgi:uncharacterized protein YoxC